MRLAARAQGGGGSRRGGGRSASRPGSRARSPAGPGRRARSDGCRPAGKMVTAVTMPAPPIARDLEAVEAEPAGRGWPCGGSQGAPRDRRRPAAIGSGSRTPSTTTAGGPAGCATIWKGSGVVWNRSLRRRFRVSSRSWARTWRSSAGDGRHAALRSSGGGPCSRGLGRHRPRGPEGGAGPADARALRRRRSGVRRPGRWRGGRGRPAGRQGGADAVGRAGRRRRRAGVDPLRFRAAADRRGRGRGGRRRGLDVRGSRLRRSGHARARPAARLRRAPPGSPSSEPASTPAW